MSVLQSRRRRGPSRRRSGLRDSRSVPGVARACARRDYTFNPGTWNVGFVKRLRDNPKHVFLLVTLEKGGTESSHQYGDRFLDRDLFQWQSQNRTTRAGPSGRLLNLHEASGVSVHLFVREYKRGARGGASFTYSGAVTFVD